MGDISEELTCSVCLDTFKNPYLLPCGHSFCFDCLQGLRNAADFKCPDCRRECRQWEDIVRNYKLANIVQVFLSDQNSRPGSYLDYNERKVAYWLLMTALLLLVAAVTLKRELEATSEELLDSQTLLKNLYQENVPSDEVVSPGLAWRVVGILTALPYWLIVWPLLLLWDVSWWLVSLLFYILYLATWMIYSCLCLVVSVGYGFVFNLFNMVVYATGIVYIYSWTLCLLRKRNTT